MVLQRWQTFFLLIAIAAMCWFAFTPFGQVSVVEANQTVINMLPKEAPVLLTVVILVTVLLLLTIFMYKNIRQQMKATILSILLICVTLVTSIFIVYNTEKASLIWNGGVLLLLVALLASLWAWRLMRKDFKLLKSYNRLR